MKVRVFSRIIAHEKTKDDKLGAEFETRAGGIHDLPTEEAYYLIGKGLASEIRPARGK